MTRDEVFLNTINQIYEHFNLNQTAGNISAYTYSSNQIDEIKDTSGQGDIAYIIHETGAFIIVDYALIINEIQNKTIMINDIIKEMYKEFEEQIGFLAACDCGSVFAYRETRNDFDKTKTTFTLDISDGFLDNNFK